ncbi:MAG: hypothetical protein M1828_004263 [Chrysothrix sp. TS-e1954]|nr:MAG: hypothetical protein M1828_004263 [Chrysothrix sp. TS-e1954]
MAPSRAPAPQKQASNASQPPEPTADPNVISSSSSSTACSETEDDTPSKDDPVTATYNVFINAPSNPLQHIYLLQFPTRPRDRPYNISAGLPPSAFRLKPETGFAELDVPIPTEECYDRAKATKWGEALNKTDGGEGLGLSGGFVGRRRRHDTSRERERDAMEVDPEDEAVKKQTLGGMVVPAANEAPAYMVGAFHDDELHLTPLTGHIQLRPQHPHIDAAALLARQAAHQASLLQTPSLHPPKASQPRAIHASLRTTDDPYATTRRLIAAAAEEGWKHLAVRDQESEEAYDAYEHWLFNEDGREEGGGREKLASKTGKEAYLDLLCEGLGGDERGRRRARSRRRKRVQGKKARAKAGVEEERGSAGEDGVVEEEG